MSCLSPKERIQYFQRWPCSYEPKDSTVAPLNSYRVTFYFGECPASAEEAQRLKNFLEDGIQRIFTDNTDQVTFTTQPLLKKVILRLRNDKNAPHFHDLFLMLALLKLHFTSRMSVEPSTISSFEMVSREVDPENNRDWRALAYWLRFVYV